MTAHATYDDVNLILRLYELRREEKMRKARAWFTSSFKIRTLEELNALCPPGSEENAYYRMILTYWEMVASFMTSEVLDQELFFQSGRELLLVWVRISTVLPELRAANKDPGQYRNLEKVAHSFIQWMNAHSPETFPAFSARVKGV
ncbi:MAG: hypothetical protein U0V70_02710 [Terriglobia bacterium]